MLFTVWLYAKSFSAHGTEDMELPEDEEMRLPKQTVTATRGRGNSSLANTIVNIVSSGDLSDIYSLGLIGDEYSFAIACQRNPDNFACDRLKCEINPNLKECENRLDTIIVTAERPDPNEVYCLRIYCRELRVNVVFITLPVPATKIQRQIQFYGKF